ncbi:Leo1-like protein [Gracilaria domingensis]|nr:Leo1-like protein [Gracilaria domingensis]
MSDISEDEFGESAALPRTKEAAAAARDIIDLSDDDSEEEQNRPVEARQKTLSPVREDEDEMPRSDEEPQMREPDGEYKQESNIDPETEPAVEDDVEAYGEEARLDQDREMTPDIEDKYERVTGHRGEGKRKVDILHFPPSISLHTSLTTDSENLPDLENPIMFRLKPEMKKPGQSDAETLLKFIKANPNPFALKRILDTNAHLITWSDGSKTITIGNEQFLLIDDVLASRHYVFRRGDRIQTFEAEVGSIRRVQPSTTGSSTAKMALAKAQKRARGTNSISSGRTMMRCLDNGGELEEEKAKQENLRRQRERMRMEAKRRQQRERAMRPTRGLTTEMLESNEEESGEDEKMRRIEERVGESRLMRAKRATTPRIEVSVKRRKVGARRILSDYDDGDDESE